MRPAERGFLLLGSCLGDSRRHPLSVAQMRILADRARLLDRTNSRSELQEADLVAVGYGREMAERIVKLLSEEDVLDYYLQKARKSDCIPLTRVTAGYPFRVREGLGLESPNCLWAKGDLSLLDGPKVALVGSRELRQENAAFARKAGQEAARQGYTLVSGNARGADRTAQEACLAAGGRVISVIADRLAEKESCDGVLYLSEEDYDQSFSPQRALSRNRVIHALADLALVAQCDLESGGTWQGAALNLRHGWSPVRCFRDGSEAAAHLEQMGAVLIGLKELEDLLALKRKDISLFDL